MDDLCARVQAFTATPQTAASVQVFLKELENDRPVFPDANAVLFECMLTLDHAETIKLLDAIKKTPDEWVKYEHCNTTYLVGWLLTQGLIPDHQIAAYSPFFEGDVPTVMRMLADKGLNVKRLDHMNTVLNIIKTLF